MKRRLTLARALVNDPDIIFLDEPTTGLDPQARHLIWERLKRLQASGKTLLLTTHFMDEAERLCDRLAILDHGSLIAEGAPRELISALHRTAGAGDFRRGRRRLGERPQQGWASASRWPATPLSSIATTPRRCSWRWLANDAGVDPCVTSIARPASRTSSSS
jgi:ABC-type multidrug transport system ATPase subunit